MSDLLVPHAVRLIFGSDYRLLIPASALWRRNRNCSGRHAGANGRRADGIACRRHDGDGRSADLHLSASPEASGEHTRDAMRRRSTAVGKNVRRGNRALNVEQASYAYSTSAQSAPTFTLGATSFQAHERELVAILGPNASGKSTLLRLISGTIAPLSGRVELDGEETSRLDVRTRAQRIAVVHQESPARLSGAGGGFCFAGPPSVWAGAAICEQGRYRNRAQRARAGGRGTSLAIARLANFPAARNSA